MISAIELQKHIVNASILDIIISKLYYKKKLYLIILFKVNKSPKIGLHHIIWPFGLMVHL